MRPFLTWSASTPRSGDNIHMVDMSTLLTVRTTDYYQSSPTAGFDSLHPSQTGYQKMGDAWYPALTAEYQALEATPTPTPTPTATSRQRQRRLIPTATPTPDPTVTPTVDPTADADAYRHALAHPKPVAFTHAEPQPDDHAGPREVLRRLRHVGGNQRLMLDRRLQRDEQGHLDRDRWPVRHAQHSHHEPGEHVGGGRPQRQAVPGDGNRTPGIAFTGGVWVRASAHQHHDLVVAARTASEQHGARLCPRQLESDRRQVAFLDGRATPRRKPATA